MEGPFGGQSRLAFLPRSSITYHRSAYSRGGSCLPWIKDGLWYVGIYSSVAYFQALDSSVCYKQSGVGQDHVREPHRQEQVGCSSRAIHTYYPWQDQNMLTLIDSGIGMTKSDLVQRVAINDIEDFEAKLFCSMMCSEAKLDSHRFKDIINQVVAKGREKLRSGRIMI
ncbi:uncharacterized protein LOC124702514 isoform X2 [Lolium rigidum]|uniref:uncharacterized protein LOC124702514 isoform X2 n=1 Tax=Lolium rigidum TaxID=89674 RepID=UPI001F5D459C|nr:uncharacterized protein LOC124702514 isoform X2 [Lolium rigidum]